MKNNLPWPRWIGSKCSNISSSQLPAQGSSHQQQFQLAISHCSSHLQQFQPAIIICSTGSILATIPAISSRPPAAMIYNKLSFSKQHFSVTPKIPFRTTLFSPCTWTCKDIFLPSAMQPYFFWCIFLNKTQLANIFFYLFLFCLLSSIIQYLSTGTYNTCNIFFWK